MRPLQISIPILTALIAAGCAIHPLPEDYSGVSTYHIVKQIRCETRKASIEFILNLLTDGKNPNKVDSYDESVGRKFLDQQNINNFRPDMLHKARPYVEVLWNTAIVYNYNLEMVETNDLSTELNALSKFPQIGRSLNFKAGLDRSRQNTRTFSVTDDLGSLISKVKNDYCTDHIVQENVIYPIAGKVGMAPVIREFMNLTVYGNLTGDGSKSVTDPSGPPTMADQLEFITTISASATPKITFTPVAPSFHLGDISFVGAVTRKDTHKLTVGLAVPKRAQTGLGGLREQVYLGFITADAKNAAERAAAQAADQLVAQKLLQRTIVIQN